jgi:phosphohistidine swiveling domain-containing protein
VDSAIEWVTPLAQAASVDERWVGGKAAKLAQLAQAGYRVADGFCITTIAYEQFLEQTSLTRAIRMELGRKPFEALRWEELWDTALRIRSAFLSTPVPRPVADAIGAAVEALGSRTPLAVRSSAPGEDSAQRSFAGLHESVVGVAGIEAVLDAVRVVWASLWSDAALLYRQELALDPAHSRMAVVVQEVVDEDRSGVAFGRDPRDVGQQHAIIEAVPGPCADLVDGAVDPDRWILHRVTGEVVDWRPGEREEGDRQPILDPPDLNRVLGTLRNVEDLFQWAPDMEWTGRQERFTLLQARPITTAAPDADDVRTWYLTLRPGARRLQHLRQRVAGELIPELQAVGERLAAEPIEAYDDEALAAAILERQADLEAWRQVYLDDFIPFAHGVRQLGTYYNDAVRPEDPYEFVGLLRGEQMAASQRNQALRSLALQLAANDPLRSLAAEVAEAGNPPDKAGWQETMNLVRRLPGGQTFVQNLEALRAGAMDVAYGSERLSARPDLLLHTLLEMAAAEEAPSRDATQGDVSRLEQRLFAAVGAGRRAEAEEVLATGRVSWRLRDDDNVLVGRLESQLLRALQLAAVRLQRSGRLAPGAKVGITAAQTLAEALRNPPDRPVELPAEPEARAPDSPAAKGETARQLVGQPASPGLASGRARAIRSTEDLGRFRAGEVLVCDAIQPTMTHLVPLARAVVERRGGMLIHGAIIARELGIPCVNGIAHAVEQLPDGEIVTVDGYLGIVTVGPPEFELELQDPPPPPDDGAPQAAA